MRKQGNIPKIKEKATERLREAPEGMEMHLSGDVIYYLPKRNKR